VSAPDVFRWRAKENPATLRRAGEKEIHPVEPLPLPARYSLAHLQSRDAETARACRYAPFQRPTIH
jgi:hypothetical protein